MRLPDTINSIADRILNRLVQGQAASATQCHYQYDCGWDSGPCGENRNQSRRLVCIVASKPIYGSWEFDGCCTDS